MPVADSPTRGAAIQSMSKPHSVSVNSQLMQNYRLGRALSAGSQIAVAFDSDSSRPRHTWATLFDI